MKTKLCPRCEKILPLTEFGRRHKKGKPTKIPQCKKCKCEVRLQWERQKNEAAGKLFASTRRYDPDRADRLDRFRGMVKHRLPLTAEPIVVQEETDEYHLFYTGSEKV